MENARPHVRMIVALAALLLVAAACGGEDEGGGTTGPTAETAATGPTAPTGATGETGDGGGAAATVQANNFSFDPSELEVASGSELEVRNGHASTPHTFTVQDTDLDVELGGGESEVVTIDLEPGTYGFVCRFHPQMTGTLTVT